MATLRDYRPDDLERCMDLVNQAWDFDGHLEHPAVAAVAKDFYVNGSLAESRHYRVVEDDGVVLGLLFGAAGHGSLFDNGYRGLAGGLRMLGRLLGAKGWGFGEKLRWLRAIGAHNVARRSVLALSDSEITLLVVDAAARGRGLGRMLMDEYIDLCRSLGKDRITVETDLHSNFGFYEHYGYRRVGTFDSPMTLLFAGDSGDTFVYVLDL